MPAFDHEALFQCLLTMVRAVQRNSVALEDGGWRKTSEPKAWSKEFRTVHFRVARRMGHTTMGLDLARGLGLETLYMVPSATHVAHVQKLIADAPALVTVLNTFTPPSILRKLTPELIVMDGASWGLSRKRLDRMYEIFKGVDPLYVLLQ